MTQNKTYVLLSAAALLICLVVAASFTPEASAQSVPAPASQSEKPIKARFEVLHMLYQSLQVRSLADMREIHTFTYTPAIRDKMQSIFNAGGYQYGDKVVVWYKRGGDVAYKIKGKPSKPK
jgi:hypothetical protein